jgi:hypothetical protein
MVSSSMINEVLKSHIGSQLDEPLYLDIILHWNTVHNWVGGQLKTPVLEGIRRDETFHD